LVSPCYWLDEIWRTPVTVSIKDSGRDNVRAYASLRIYCYGSQTFAIGANGFLQDIGSTLGPDE